jgi:putative ABC transport system ATP-binding protein
MLKLQDVKKHYNAPEGMVRALEGASLEVEAGEFVVVQGPSGCGKTTLLLVAGALLSPTEGQILINGQNPYRLSAEERAQLRASTIGFVFQQFHLVPYLTVLENVIAPSLALPKDKTLSRDQLRERAEELLQRFNLSDRASHVPADLSTGERQRVALARALLNRPTLLLADEPTGNLDPENAEVVLRHIGDFAGSGGAVLLVTHQDMSRYDASRLVKMNQGKFV